MILQKDITRKQFIKSETVEMFIKNNLTKVQEIADTKSEGSSSDNI
jgi:hypothetical protein